MPIKKKSSDDLSEDEDFKNTTTQFFDAINSILQKIKRDMELIEKREEGKKGKYTIYKWV